MTLWARTWNSLRLHTCPCMYTSVYECRQRTSLIHACTCVHAPTHECVRLREGRKNIMHCSSSDTGQLQQRCNRCLACPTMPKKTKWNFSILCLFFLSFFSDLPFFSPFSCEFFLPHFLFLYIFIFYFVLLFFLLRFFLLLSILLPFLCVPVLLFSSPLDLTCILTKRKGATPRGRRSYATEWGTISRGAGARKSMHACDWLLDKDKRSGRGSGQETVQFGLCKTTRRRPRGPIEPSSHRDQSSVRSAVAARGAFHRLRSFASCEIAGYNWSVENLRFSPFKFVWLDRRERRPSSRKILENWRTKHPR